MSKITDDDVTASVLAYGKASSSGCRDKWLSLAGMRAAAKEIERRVLERVKAETTPMHEPVTNAEIDDFMRAISDPYEGNMTPREVTGIALDNFLARRAAITSFHEPVSGPEVLEMAAAAAAVAPGEFFFHREERMRAAGNALLARRAAATRVPLVVTADAVDRAGRRIFGSTWLRVSKAAEDVRAALEEFVAGEPDKPVDPRAGLVLSWANNTLGAQNVLDEDIASLLAKLDEVKP